MQRNCFVDCAIQLMIAVLKKNPQVLNQKLNSELITSLIYSNMSFKTTPNQKRHVAVSEWN